MSGKKRTMICSVKLLRFVILTGIVILLSMFGCGGGGGDPTPTKVTVSGTVDDGAENSPIDRAICAFYDMQGNKDSEVQTDTADSLGRFTLYISPDKQGFIQCHPPNLPNLILSNFISTIGWNAGETISNENVNPERTLISDNIGWLKPASPEDQKSKLLTAFKTDPELQIASDMAARLYSALWEQNKVPENPKFNGDFGGGGGGSGGGGDGGGVGGSAGDGGVTSPIADARCEYIVNNNLNGGSKLYFPALSDFLDDGLLNRTDLQEASKVLEEATQSYGSEKIKSAFAKLFENNDGYGKMCTTVAENNGAFFVEIPPDIPGFIRCYPPEQDNLVLATYVDGREQGKNIENEDVNPKTTYFSHKIASKLTENIGTAKQNYLADTSGLGDVQIVREEESITGFKLDPSSDPSNDDISLIAFTATSLFNILYKNGSNADYLGAMDDLLSNKAVTAESLTNRGAPAESAEEWANVVVTSYESPGEQIEDPNLARALSTAYLDLMVTDQPGDGGKGVPFAQIDIIDAPDGIECNCNLPLETDENGQLELTFTGVANEASQITIEVSGVSGSLPKTANADITAAARVEVIIPMGEEPCIFSINPVEEQFAYESNSRTISVFASGDDCTWAASSTDSWITIESGNYGTGDGKVTYTISSNTTDVERVGTISVAENTYTITQGTSGPCTYSINPANASFSYIGGGGTTNVDSLHAGCEWTASTEEEWISIDSGSPNNGDGAFSYTVSANTGPERTGTITVAGQIHTITQVQVPCTYSIDPTPAAFPYEGGSGTLNVDSLHAGCEWTASTEEEWISIDSGSPSNGDGIFSYTVSANTGPERTGTITVAGQIHTITQDQAVCTYTIEPADADFPNEGGNGSISVDAAHEGCEWTANTEEQWITIDVGQRDRGDGTVNYTVLVNTESSRTGLITINGVNHTVNQVPGPCAYSIDPMDATFERTGGNGVITVNANRADCEWNVSTSGDWITIDSENISGMGNGRVTYSVSENNSSTGREGTITIAGNAHIITQSWESFEDFLGVWDNDDPETTGITRILVNDGESNLLIHAFGACVPTDCDWGTVASTFPGSSPITAFYDHGFATSTLTIYLLRPDSLHVHLFTDFTEADGRQDYERDYYFHPLIID